MARPSVLPVSRLSFKVWIRAALIEYVAAVDRGDISPRSPFPAGKGAWEWFARELFGDLDTDESLEENAARNLLGVANDGNDPRKHRRYIPVSRVKDHGIYEGCKIVPRRPGGPAPKDDVKSQDAAPHYDVLIDLVKLIEYKLPGSSAWETAFLWDLLAPGEPLSLEVVRRAIGDLLRSLKLVRPSLAQRRQFLPKEDFDKFRRVGFEEQKIRYREALVPLTQLGCAHSVSLLAALCAESYLGGNVILPLNHGHAVKRHVVARTLRG